MCGRNQKIDLGELPAERWIKSQVRGNDPDPCGACQALQLNLENPNPKQERR